MKWWWMDEDLGLGKDGGDRTEPNGVAFCHKCDGAILLSCAGLK
jgi:hypothetical protein